MKPETETTPANSATELKNGFNNVPIVGIGTSAGGLKALRGFLSEIPIKTGMSYVIIQHLDAQHDSQLVHFLKQNSRIPIDEAVDGTLMVANRAYVIMPNMALRVENGVLKTSARDHHNGINRCIDIFLQSLALEQHRRIIAVILSGTGSDGTLGLAAVKNAGGMTFVQDETAEHAGMPHSAIENGQVDFVLTPAEIAKEICKFSEFGFPENDFSNSLNLQESDAVKEDGANTDDAESYRIILGMLKSATGVDFTQYKSSTILRRTKRRMNIVHTARLSDYCRKLEADPEEIQSLARDILIHVTGFFRDPAVFSALASIVFPSIMQGRDPESPIRIWVIGCSTGQEVYSIAMELVDFLSAQSSKIQIQMFATDISDWALGKARFGWYPENIIDEIPADRINRFFTKESSGYRIQKSIRDMCVFAKHDVSADVPFSHIDFISCRNVLIYFGQVLQKRIIPTFHFSLKRGGFLLLGSSESIGPGIDLFESVEDKSRIYRSIRSTSRISRQSFIPTGHLPKAPVPSVTPVPLSPSEMQRSADQLLLDRFAPASVLITHDMEIIQFRGQSQNYLENAQGSATLNILSMLPFGTGETFREALAEAKHNDLPVRRKNIALRRTSSYREINFEIIPMNILAESRYYLVIFEDSSEPENRAGVHGNGEISGPTSHVQIETPRESDSNDVALLRKQFAESLQHINSLVFQSRTLTDQNLLQIDQLRAAQDESQSINEEFRSTNEELQTAKEELESSNEELITINDELRAANEDIGKASLALQASGELTAAIVETMRYPLLVLDSNLMVISANQAFLNSFKIVRERTMGQLIYELGDGQWNIPDLRRLLEDLLPAHDAFDDFIVTHDFKNLGLRTMLLNARRLHERDVTLRRIVLVIADITDQTRINKELKELSSELLRSNAELDQFASVASHDIQEPLRMISAYTALLKRRYDPIFDNTAREFMAHIITGALRMREMINGILLYSRLGHEATDVTTIDLSAILTNAIDMVKVKVEEAQGTIISGPLPQVVASASQIFQLFLNLLSNAIKFRSDKRALTIHISAQESAHDWTISIADNGIGMEESHFKKIFKLFQRLPTDRKVSGTGIGLATCKKIVEHHHGSIWVESVLDEGCTFKFTLPK